MEGRWCDGGGVCCSGVGCSSCCDVVVMEVFVGGFCVVVEDGVEREVGDEGE